MDGLYIALSYALKAAYSEAIIEHQHTDTKTNTHTHTLTASPTVAAGVIAWQPQNLVDDAPDELLLLLHTRGLVSTLKRHLQRLLLTVGEH